MSKHYMVTRCFDALEPIYTDTFAVELYGKDTPRTRAKTDNHGSTLCNRAKYANGKYPAYLKRPERPDPIRGYAYSFRGILPDEFK